jgi:hypothetical protein
LVNKLNFVFKSMLKRNISIKQGSVFFYFPDAGLFFFKYVISGFFKYKVSLSRLIYCESKAERTCLISKKLSRKKQPVFVVKKILLHNDYVYSMWTKVIPFPPSSLYISYKTIYFHKKKTDPCLILIKVYFFHT